MRYDKSCPSYNFGLARAARSVRKGKRNAAEEGEGGLRRAGGRRDRRGRGREVEHEPGVSVRTGIGGAENLQKSSTKSITHGMKITVFYQAPSEARGVVIGGSEYVKSCRKSSIDSEMAGPISMKLSGIDRGNSVTVLGQRN